MILVTGAAGKTGEAVLRALSAKGTATRGLIHRADQVDLATQAGAREVVIGDLLDSEVLANALAGVEAIYLICPNVHPKEFEIGRSLIAASKADHVPRIVYHSVMFPQIEAMPHHWQKLRVEEELIQSGLPFSILQPASYMQSILPYWDAIRQRGEYLVPYSVDSVFSPVELTDVADVACRVLTESEHDGATYQLAGPQHLSSRQMAQLIGTSLGREIKASAQSIADWNISAAAQGMSTYSIGALTKMFRYYDKHGFAGSSIVLENLLGRPARLFSQLLSRMPK